MPKEGHSNSNRLQRWHHPGVHQPHLVFVQVFCQFWVMCFQQLHQLGYRGLDTTRAVVQLLAKVVPAGDAHNMRGGGGRHVHIQCIPLSPASRQQVWAYYITLQQKWSLQTTMRTVGAGESARYAHPSHSCLIPLTHTAVINIAIHPAPHKLAHNTLLLTHSLSVLT